MKIPNEITKSWLSKKGYEVGTVYREKGGHRAVILTQRGRKWVHFLELGAIGSSPSKFKLAVQEARRAATPRKTKDETGIALEEARAEVTPPHPVNVK